MRRYPYRLSAALRGFSEVVDEVDIELPLPLFRDLIREDPINIERAV